LLRERLSLFARVVATLVEVDAANVEVDVADT
jgi:hypothetical protein